MATTKKQKVKEMVKYNFWTGVFKSIKNCLVVLLPPAVLVLANNYVDWVPAEWYPVAVPVLSMTSYMVKNYVQVKNE